MRRLLSLLPLLVVAAACGDTATPVVPAVRAPAQQAVLGWSERYPAEQTALVFGVQTFTVTEHGWRARVSVANRSAVGWEVGDPHNAIERLFGVLLFPNDDLEELARRNREGSLPAVRRAIAFEPKLPAVLEPGATWSGTISAPGALAGGLWVRISFGTFTSVGDPPEGAQQQVVWFTDHAYQLRRR